MGSAQCSEKSLNGSVTHNSMASKRAVRKSSDRPDAFMPDYATCLLLKHLQVMDNVIMAIIIPLPKPV